MTSSFKVAMKNVVAKIERWLPDWLALWFMSLYLFLRQRVVFDLTHKLKKSSSARSDSRSPQWIKDISREGYAVVPNFKSLEWCAAVREDLRRALTDPQRATQHSEDSRVFGIENLSTHAASFANDPQLLDLASRYSKSQERLLFCMGNCVSFRDSLTYGSGGEWHRDGFRRELKAMVYLNEVNDTDGPLAVLERSHRWWRMARDVALIGGALRRKDASISGATPTRLKNAGYLLGAKNPARLRSFTEPAGTLILFDTSLVHTGLPPESNGSERLALTNYYFAAESWEVVRDYYRLHVTLN